MNDPDPTAAIVVYFGDMDGFGRIFFVEELFIF